MSISCHFLFIKNCSTLEFSRIYGRMQTNFVISQFDGTKLMYRYILGPDYQVDLPAQHCKHCHHTFVCTSGKPSRQCTNCRSRRWYVWPENFDSEKLTCEDCKRVWYQEQLEPDRVSSPKRRGPKSKKKQID
jgi:hypothetical protein